MAKKTETQEIAEKVVHKRPKRSENYKLHMAEGENQKFTSHTLQVASLDKVDCYNADQVWGRITEYFTICQNNDMKPSVAGLALAFGINRVTLWDYANGNTRSMSKECVSCYKKAYTMLNAAMEDYMQNGKINPVSGIFLMKNNMGYRDQQEVVVTPQNQLGDQTSAEELQQKYLTDVIEVDPPAEN